MKAANSKIDPLLIPKNRDWNLPANHYLDSEPYTYLALVDRNKSTSKWWTQNKEVIIQFHSQEAADKVCSSLKFGNPVVVKYATMVHKTSHWFIRTEVESSYSRALNDKLSQWHDDDWYEGIND